MVWFSLIEMEICACIKEVCIVVLAVWFSLIGGGSAMDVVLRWKRNTLVIRMARELCITITVTNEASQHNEWVVHNYTVCISQVVLHNSRLIIGECELKIPLYRVHVCVHKTIKILYVVRMAPCSFHPCNSPPKSPFVSSLDARTAATPITQPTLSRTTSGSARYLKYFFPRIDTPKLGLDH